MMLDRRYQCSFIVATSF